MKVLPALVTFVCMLGCRESTDVARGVTTTVEEEKANYAEKIRGEYMHAWNAYKKYAWGNDDLKPLSKAFHNWYEEPLLMSAVDALDGLILLGFDNEAARTKEYIATHLSFDKDMYVKNFEITIRLLGGLISSYQLTGDKRLLNLAEDLASRLLPAFDSPTGMPYTYVNLRTGDVREPITNPAEIGTLILELGSLSRLTGKPIFYEKAKRAVVEVFDRRSGINLVGAAIDVETGEWRNSTSHISGRIDSYYEYLLKAWLLFGDTDFKDMWDIHIAAINKHLATEAESGFWYRWVDMNTGEEVEPYFGALDAFFPALLALSGDLERAERLQASCFSMWNLFGVEPEIIDFKKMEVREGSEAYHLRPEIIESAYYLYHFTGHPVYHRMGKKIFEDLIKYCRTEAGYAALKNVKTKEKLDHMESYFFGETLKYLYLLFTDEESIDLDEVVFTTEAHPLRRAWRPPPP